MEPTDSRHNTNSSAQEVHELEKSGGSAKISHEEMTHKKSHIESDLNFSGVVKVKYVAPVLFVCTLFVVAVGALLFLSPMLVLINNKEQLTNDLNDGLYAYHIYSQRILGGQLGNQCDDKTIECKFKTLSPMLQQRFEQYGFDVKGTLSATTGRYNNATFKAPDSSRTAKDTASLTSIRKQESRSDALIERVFSSKNGLYQDRQFSERLFSRFGLAQDNTLGGFTKEEFKKSFDTRVTQGDQRYVDPNQTPANAAQTSQQSQDEIDENGQGIYSLRSLQQNTDAWGQKIYPNLLNKANTHLSTACALSTYADLMENSLYRASRVSAARFAMNYLAVADNLKARAGTTGMQVAVDYMANNLLQSDENGENAMNGPTYKIPALGDTPQVTGELSVLEQITTKISSLVARVAAFPGTLGEPLTATTILTGAPGRSASQLCAHGMTGDQQSSERDRGCFATASSPLLSAILPAGSIILTSVLGSLQGAVDAACRISLKAVVEVVKAPIAAYEIPVSQGVLSVASGLEADKYNAETNGRAAQNIIFSGAGEILGDRAQSLGMRPSDRQSFREYNEAAQTAYADIQHAERALARTAPWDATNPHSFLGSIVATVVPKSTTVLQSWRTSAASILNVVPSSVAMAASTSAEAIYAQPVHLQPNRLSPANSLACGVDTNMSTVVMLDIACNTRYSMSQQELSLGIDEILDYMTQPHPQNAQVSLNEINARDFAADSATGDRMKSEAQEGANASYIDETGKPNKFTEYSKFLTYCTNRYNQWGRVGMALQDTDEQYVEDEEINGVRQSHGNSLLRTKPPTVTPESYYGFGWGSQADQDWYTGKKCAEDSEMLSYFRGYTMACGVLAGMSASRQCWHDDTVPSFTQDDFYTTNDIIFKSAS